MFFLLVHIHCVLMVNLVDIARLYLLLATTVTGLGRRGAAVMAWRSHGSDNNDLISQLKSKQATIVKATPGLYSVETRETDQQQIYTLAHVLLYGVVVHFTVVQMIPLFSFKGMAFFRQIV